MMISKCFWALALLSVVSAFTSSQLHLHRGIIQRKSFVNKMVSQSDIKMPALSSTMKEGKIVAWNKKVGDKVQSGDVLLVVESDKADMDVESFEDGYLAAIHTPEGGSAAVGAAVATLVQNVADIGKVGKPSAIAAAPTIATPVVPVAVAAVPVAVPVSAQSSVAAPAFEQILMPALSSTMKEGKIVAWSKKVGDKISAGDMVLVVESDKADMDVESYENGFLAVIAVADGEVAQVGRPVGYIAKTKEDIPAVQAHLAGGGGVAGASGGAAIAAPVPVAAAATPLAGATAVVAVPAAAAAVVNTGRVSASGFAQAVAKEQGIDLRTVQPSRADQYILASDLAGLAGTPPAHVSAPGVINATPMARKLAADNNLDVAKIQGTGSFNRVTPDDVLRAAGKLPVAAAVAAPLAQSAPAATRTGASTKVATPAAAAAAVQEGLRAMDGMQKAVAKNMEKTLAVPVFRVSREIATDQFDALYAKLKDKGVSVSALLAKAVAEVLKKHPIMNAAYSAENGGSIKYNKDTNIAMAVAIDGGLITPTITGAQSMDLFSVSRRWRELVDKAKGKKLTPAEYSSGTFTITNLGMFGVQQFDAILPPNTGSILAISAAVPRVVPLKNGHFGVQKSMTVTITCDHRHIYGADAAEFLRDLAELLENNVSSLTMG